MPPLFRRAQVMLLPGTAPRSSGDVHLFRMSGRVTKNVFFCSFSQQRTVRQRIFLLRIDSLYGTRCRSCLLIKIQNSLSTGSSWFSPHLYKAVMAFFRGVELVFFLFHTNSLCHLPEFLGDASATKLDDLHAYNV